MFESLPPGIQTVIKEIEAERAATSASKRRRALVFIRKISTAQRRRLLTAVADAVLEPILSPLDQAKGRRDTAGKLGDAVSDHAANAAGPVMALLAAKPFPCRAAESKRRPKGKGKWKGARGDSSPTPQLLERSYWRRQLFTDLSLWEPGNLRRLLKQPLPPNPFNRVGSNGKRRTRGSLARHRRLRFSLWGLFVAHHRHHPQLPRHGQRKFLRKLFDETSTAERLKLWRRYTNDPFQKYALMLSLQQEAVTRLYLRVLVYSSREGKIVCGGFPALVSAFGSGESVAKLKNEVTRVVEATRQQLLLQTREGRGAGRRQSFPRRRARAGRGPTKVVIPQISPAISPSSGKESTPMMKRISKVWRNLGDEEKERWNVLRTTKSNLSVGGNGSNRILSYTDDQLEAMLDYRLAGSGFDLYARYRKVDMYRDGTLAQLRAQYFAQRTGSDGGSSSTVNSPSSTSSTESNERRAKKFRLVFHQLVSKEWKAMDPDQRLAFQFFYPYPVRGRYRQDRTLEPSASPYYQFVRSEANKLRIEGVKFNAGAFARACAAKWRAMTPEERKQYASTVFFDSLFPLVGEGEEGEVVAAAQGSSGKGEGGSSKGKLMVSSKAESPQAQRGVDFTDSTSRRRAVLTSIQSRRLKSK